MKDFWRQYAGVERREVRSRLFERRLVDAREAQGVVRLDHGFELPLGLLKLAHFLERQAEAVYRGKIIRSYLLRSLTDLSSSPR